MLKKESTLDPKNYRGISLLNTRYKILLTILLEKITPYAEDIIGRYQCNFRKKKSTTGYVFIFKQTMENIYESNKKILIELCTDVHGIY